MIQDEAPGEAGLRVHLSDEVLFRQLKDEAVLLDLDSQRYYGLDAVGTRLWSLLVENPSLERARVMLLAEFETEAATLEHDVNDFLGELVAKGLVRLELDSGSSP